MAAAPLALRFFQRMHHPPVRVVATREVARGVVIQVLYDPSSGAYFVRHTGNPMLDRVPQGAFASASAARDWADLRFPGGTWWPSFDRRAATKVGRTATRRTYLSTDLVAERDAIAAGVAAGLFAGTMMALFLLIVAGVRGEGFWTPLQLVAAALAPRASVPGGPGSVVAGALIHLTLSAGAGAVYGVLFGHLRSPAAEFAIGVVTGVGLFLVMAFFVLPWIDVPMAGRYTDREPWTFLIAHILFGTFLSLALPIRETLDARRPSRPAASS